MYKDTYYSLLVTSFYSPEAKRTSRARAPLGPSRFHLAYVSDFVSHEPRPTLLAKDTEHLPCASAGCRSLAANLSSPLSYVSTLTIPFDNSRNLPTYRRFLSSGKITTRYNILPAKFRLRNYHSVEDPVKRKKSLRPIFLFCQSLEILADLSSLFERHTPCFRQSHKPA